MLLCVQEDLSEPLYEEDLDGSAGVLFPFYDPDTHMLYLAGKVTKPLQPILHFLCITGLFAGWNGTLKKNVFVVLRLKVSSMSLRICGTTVLICVCVQGDGNIRFYELSAEKPFISFLNEYRSVLPQKGLGQNNTRLSLGLLQFQ